MTWRTVGARPAKHPLATRGSMGRARRAQASVAIGSVGIILAALATAPVATAQSAGAGTIAYLSPDRHAIHLMAPDGSGDRVLWSAPKDTVYGIQDVEWSPDGTRLAISSGHEALCSIYQYDLYTLGADGSDLARVTNGPACAALADLPTGSVSVKVENDLLTESQFLVYVAGAPEAQLVTIPSGFVGTVSFPAVADLGPGVLQSVVASVGDQRWFAADVAADVTADETVDAGTLVVDGDGITTLGALTVSWSPDGSTLGYQLGQGALWQVGADPTAGIGEQPLLALPPGTTAMGNDLTWSPVGDEVLYERFDTDPWTVSLATVGGADPGREIVTVKLTHGIAWLPDASGFVVAASDSLLASADLYLVGLPGGSATQLTAEGDAFAYWPSVSPDGQHIAYTRIEGSPSAPTKVELRVMGIDGSDDHAIAQDAIMPSWGRATLP